MHSRQKSKAYILVLQASFAALVAAVLCIPVDAFHRGGVGECEGCHTIHNSVEGQPGSPAGLSGNYLLKGSDASSVCLNCHQVSGDTGPTGYHVSTAPVDMPAGTPPRQMTPGGDFGWLKKSYTWFNSLGSTTIQRSPANSHGHNIVAMDYGYDMDYDKPKAPGGDYPSSAMSCTSCHDPHGKYRRLSDGSISTVTAPIKGSGSLVRSAEPDAQNAVGVYRLLAGIGYYQKSQGMSNVFSSNPPAAVAPDIYNRSESVSQTRVAYGTGMSEWCRNCHSDIHTDTVPASLKHPSGGIGGAMGKSIAGWYDQYIRDGDLSGVESNAYLSLVPFEIGSSDYSMVLKPIAATTPTRGPSLTDGTPQVMCLSCHRAHASGWDGSMRWNNRSPYIVYAGKYSQAGDIQPYGQGRSELEAQAAYYNIPPSTFGYNQYQFCYKCHQNGTR
ncbi:MAG: cytochrome C [Geobacteraceae bacterium]|nr:cytochrome C [Geobacteraceae bacterium]